MKNIKCRYFERFHNLVSKEYNNINKKNYKGVTRGRQRAITFQGIENKRK